MFSKIESLEDLINFNTDNKAIQDSYKFIHIVLDSITPKSDDFTNIIKFNPIILSYTMQNFIDVINELIPKSVYNHICINGGFPISWKLIAYMQRLLNTVVDNKDSISDIQNKMYIFILYLLATIETANAEIPDNASYFTKFSSYTGGYDDIYSGLYEIQTIRSRIDRLLKINRISCLDVFYEYRSMSRKLLIYMISNIISNDKMKHYLEFTRFVY